MNYAYNSLYFDPPAPAIEVEAVAQSGSKRVRLLMLIDSGADVTVVPRWVTDELDIDLSQADSTTVEGYGGNQQELPKAQLALEFGKLRFNGIFLVADGSIGYLGRNILNNLSITLNGPKQQVEI